MEIHPADAEIHGIRNGDPVKVTARRGEVVLRATVTEKTSVGVVFIPFHFAEAAANLLTNDALDPQAKIPEFKACAVQVFPAREDELANPDVVVQRGGIRFLYNAIPIEKELGCLTSSELFFSNASRRTSLGVPIRMIHGDWQHFLFRSPGKAERPC